MLYHYAECHILFIVTLNAVMLGVVILSVFMLGIVGTCKMYKKILLKVGETQSSKTLD